jgi:hypothetical protein
MRMMTLAKWSGPCMAIGSLFLWMQTPGWLHAGGFLLQAAEGVSSVEYNDDVKPIVKIQAARIYLDHEKYGFFRLGLAPLAVVQSAQIQIESAAGLTNALANLNA